MNDLKYIVAILLERMSPVNFMASFLIWVMFAILFALWVLDKRIKKEQIYHAVLASIMAWLLSELNNKPTFTLTVPHGSAFPSDHSAIAFGLAVSVWSHHKRLGIAFIVAAILVGLGRVLGNVHYFTDILGGAALGVISVIILEKLHVALQRNDEKSSGVKRKKHRT